MARAAKTPKKNTREAEDSPDPARAGDRAEAQQEGAATLTAAPDQTTANPTGERGADGGDVAKAAVAPPPEAPSRSSGAFIEVQGPKRGFRRAGRSFGPQPVRIAMSDLTQDELATLVEEPMLIVTVAPDPN